MHVTLVGLHYKHDCVVNVPAMPLCFATGRLPKI